MNRETERVKVPTNGRRPKTTPDPTPKAAVPDTPPEPDDDDTSVATIAFSPTQLAVGFGVVAGIILLLVGSRRRRRSG